MCPSYPAKLNSNPMIKAESLSFSYPGANNPALCRLELDVERGQIVCLMGANGCGKSTLLCLLAGLFSSFSGTLAVGGHTLPGNQKEVRALCGMVPQNPDLFLLGSTLREDMFLGMSKKQAGERAVLFNSLCLEMGLSGLEDRPLQTLSFGERRKASIAAALMHAPQLLLLDEPFSGLDFEAQLHLREIITENRNQGITQIVVAHDLDLIADLGERFIVLKQGEILAQGGKETVFPRLREGNVRPPCWWLHKAPGPEYL